MMPADSPHSEVTDLDRDNAEAEFTLEAPVICPACQEATYNLKVIRMLRTRVNFTSTLPRRGRAIACPNCSTLLSAELGALA